MDKGKEALTLSRDTTRSELLSRSGLVSKASDRPQYSYYVLIFDKVRDLSIVTMSLYLIR